LSEHDPVLEELRKIIESKNVRTVFQPIVDLKTGEIYGYEALSRGPEGSILESPLNLFAAAQKYNHLFAVEKLCREKVLCNAKKIMSGNKIFINFNPYALFDPEYKEANTKQIIDEFNINQNDLVIELTEKASINDFQTFRVTFEHYNKLGFAIAIDDTGAEYSGLQRIVSLNYKYIKIDPSLIKNVDRDTVKKALLEAFTKFSKKINSYVIAEGVETIDELETLIELGVDFAQGYIIATPSEHCPQEVPIANLILEKNRRKKSYATGVPILEITQKGLTISPEITTSAVINMFENSQELQSLVVLKDTMPVGLVNRELIYGRLATQYGYAIFMSRSIKTIMDDHPMIVNLYDSVEIVSKMAMERELSKRYNCIIVEKDEEYFGIVSIRNLLDKLSALQIEHAKNLNPLTALPGNPNIESEIIARINSDKPFSVLYIDLNNFKTYNDCYGYKKGDEVLLFTARTLKRTLDDQGTSGDFIGHIGGDDFIIITTPERERLICENIIKCFDSQIGGFYLEQDWRNGYVVTRDRQGNISNRPLVSIAIAIVSNEHRKLLNPLQISELASEIKEYVKAQGKSAYLKNVHHLFQVDLSESNRDLNRNR